MHNDDLKKKRLDSLGYSDALYKQIYKLRQGVETREEI